MPHDANELARKLILKLPGREGVLPHADELRAAARKRKPVVLVACMPKSGSTFLANAIAAATGYPLHSLVYAYFRNAQDLYLPALLRTLAVPTVTQQHVVATRPNLELIDLFHLKTVVLVRNIFDVVVSLRDHCLREGVETPAGVIDDAFPHLPKSEQYDLLIDVAAPWYFGFYASWFRASQNGGCDPLWLTYETLFAEPLPILHKLLEFCEAPQSVDAVRAALEKAREAGSRFNKGVTGRGTDELSAGQKERLAGLARRHPTTDFSLIGVGGTARSRKAS